ncbi:MAG: hypothetical protein R3335_08305, partial [Anaerolineales bacterium]|nr:hypothetical protein [Anaerolineales bacterium]
MTRIDRGFEVRQGPDAATGIRKSMRVELLGDGFVVVDHQIANTGSGPIETAPWAITQFRVGGVAILPQQV